MSCAWRPVLTDEQRISPVLRRFVFERAHACCEYCQSQARFATESFVVEHINPRARGGTTTLDNLALSCSGCNGHKAKKTQAVDPETGQLVTLFHPRRQRWAEHFAWNDDFSQVLGSTPCGRASVASLQINRAPLVNLRRALYLAGVHPPIKP